MAVVENWLPPSRENWEWLCYVWQFFPLVRLSCACDKHPIQDFAKSFITDHSCAMAHRLVPSRQDVNRVAMECTRQDWMGSYGVYRTDNLAVHLLYTAEGTGHCRAAMG